MKHQERVKRTLTLPSWLDVELRIQAAKQRIPVGRLAEKAIAAYLQELLSKENNVA